MSTPVFGHRYRNAFLFIVLAGVWGGTYPAVKVGLEDFPPILYAAFRLDLAAVLLLLYAANSFTYWLPRSGRDWLAVFSGGVLTLAGYSVLLNIGQRTVPSAIAAVLAGLIPLLTIGFAKALLPEEDFGITELLGVILGFVGLVVITRPDPSNLLTTDTLGQLTLVLAAASFALGGVLTQWANAEMPFSPRTAWAMLVGAIFTHVASYVSANESIQHVQISTQGVLALIYLGVFVSAIGYLIYFDLLPRLGSVELNLVTYGTAMFGTIFSWFLFGDQITIATVSGFCLIMFGFVLLKREEFYEECTKVLGDVRTESR
ncbi:DMT family transporter [Halegenticoccus tardaugens]|uniref:DMT family transporter n=1 Tax=Halegenticoccus tardaugens TaxID=2071624 RepID=UPI00100A924D|nr:DMT family transporter [Halegenticoccus tardaugens]